MSGLGAQNRIRLLPGHIAVLPQHLMASVGLRARKHGLSQPVLASPLPSGTGNYSRTLGSQDFSGGTGEEATPGTSD